MLADDLEVLDPKVPQSTRATVEKIDPKLDADVADWFADSCWRPKLSLLGPVAVQAHGQPVARRKPFLIEVLSYIALREQGATTDELATGINQKNNSSVRTAVKMVRDWLGPNPKTGRPHIPAATETEAAKQRGVGVYQVEDLLVDIDLFRRLRARGEARAVAGIDDLVTALRLVTGRPFDQLRPGGWAWLIDTCIDHNMTCAVVDVAHRLTSYFLQTEQLDRARAATETALLAAPDDYMPKLDLAAVLRAEGHNERAQIVEQELCNTLEDEGLPAEVNARLSKLLPRQNQLDSSSRKVAS